MSDFSQSCKYIMYEICDCILYFIYVCCIYDYFPIYLKIGSSLKEVEQRTVIDVIKDSLSDRPFRAHSTEGTALDEVRYKLLIDKSEDESVVRLLFAFSILDPSKTRIFMCSHFPEDSDVQMVNIFVCTNSNSTRLCVHTSIVQLNFIPAKARIGAN